MWVLALALVDDRGSPTCWRGATSLPRCLWRAKKLTLRIHNNGTRLKLGGFHCACVVRVRVESQENKST